MKDADVLSRKFDFILNTEKDIKQKMLNYTFSVEMNYKKIAERITDF